MAKILRACPFCRGTEIEVIISEWLSEPCIKVYCVGCRATIMRMGKTIKIAKHNAITAWNTRTKRDGRLKENRSRGPTG